MPGLSQILAYLLPIPSVGSLACDPSLGLAEPTGEDVRPISLGVFWAVINEPPPGRVAGTK